jgi:hypothetical protein
LALILYLKYNFNGLIRRRKQLDFAGETSIQKLPNQISRPRNPQRPKLNFGRPGDFLLKSS